MKNFCIIFIFILLTSLNNVNSQDTNDVLYRAFVFSAKIGYQTEDARNNFMLWYGEDLPAAFNFDLGFDFPLGKHYYLGLKYNGWISSDKVYDSYDTITLNRTIYGNNIDLIFKYRFVYDKFIFSPGIGIGSTSISTGYSGLSSLEQNSPLVDKMPNVCFQMDVEYFLTKNFLLSAEFSYYGMAQFDVGGGGRNNKFMQYKGGISYIFRN
ncbi:MAG: hypothetical protein EHM58_18800 [Ignavibacteriae bacterium]|nr:MAG: hypothetical protein EHM58_18800 [Ignavibacteriota bacterium]